MLCAVAPRHRLYSVFREQIFHELRITVEEFARKYKVWDNRDRVSLASTRRRPVWRRETASTDRLSPIRQSLEHIKNTQSFCPIPQAVRDFYIGGYQVLGKYLKSRKGRVLSLDEINHFGAVADCLAFTIGQMELIDKSYRAAFPDRG